MCGGACVCSVWGTCVVRGSSACVLRAASFERQKRGLRTSVAALMAWLAAKGMAPALVCSVVLHSLVNSLDC